METPREIIEFYDRYAEESRLEQGPFQLEFERTKILLRTVLPPAPARIVDVGGAAGVYSTWLAAAGYEVHLIDASPRLVAEARRRNQSLAQPVAAFDVADARALPRTDRSAEAVLVMGPLYHLQNADDRATALREAVRVAVPSGVVAVAGISRFASALDGLARARGVDEAFVRMRDDDLRDGRHRNTTGRLDYFTTAYFHRPEELRRELEEAGLEQVTVYGIEGPGWMVGDFAQRWQDPALRRDIMNVAAAVEREPSIVGASAHLLAVGRSAGA
jgi:ubiquinone/menaquinone biosynthesis C-methylase UbiE